MRRIVLAALAALVGFGLYLFWAGGRETAPTGVPEPAPAPASVPVTEAAPAEPAAGAPDSAPEAAGTAEDAAPDDAADGGAALQNEIQGLVNEAVRQEPASAEPAPAD